MERHEAVGLRSANVRSCDPVDHALEDLRSMSVFCFSGLASPFGFEEQIRARAGRYCGQRRFPDHHGYTADELRSLRAEATAADANLLVTTEKDWVKIAVLLDPKQNEPPIWRLDIEARFEAAGDAVLLDAIERVLKQQEPKDP
jgi:tetraacyldisaccharide-1-P 4'-kinase